MAGAVLFDIDGTLVDSNYLHVAAWLRACQAVGVQVATSRIHRGIGMGSEQLLPWLLGDQAESLGDRAKQVHTEAYAAAADQLQPLPGARELVRELHRRGVTCVLATSASPEELERLLGVLDLGAAVQAVTSSQDVEAAKPQPELVEVALERAGVGADDAVFVGDARWDVEAAGRAGVATIGVLTGGLAACELADAGAVATYDDPAALLRDLDASPLARLLG